MQIAEGNLGKACLFNEHPLELVSWPKTHLKLRAEGKGLNTDLALFVSIGNDRTVLILGM